MKDFWIRLAPHRRAAVLELFFVYFELGVAVILLGSVLTELRENNGLSYAQSGNLLSVQSIGFLLVGLVTGTAVLKAGMKRAYVLFIAALPAGLLMLIAGGPYAFLLLAMLLVGVSKGAITDYNNRVMSDYADGAAAPLNVLHMFFAAGACLAPFLALLTASLFGGKGWLAALFFAFLLAAAAVVFGLFVKMDLKSVSASAAETASPGPEKGLGFFRDPLYLWTQLMGICDQALEASLMGWLTTFYLNSGVIGSRTAQLVTSLLWFAFLAGRFLCSLIAGKWRPSRMLLFMGCGSALFMTLLCAAGSAPLLLAATIGLGLCLSGVYGTAVSNASHIFSEYPSAMGLYVTISGIGGAAAPALIGLVADRSSVRAGFVVLAVLACVLALAVIMNLLLLARRK